MAKSILYFITSTILLSCHSIDLRNRSFELHSSYMDGLGSGTMLQFTRTQYAIIDWRQEGASLIKDHGGYHMSGDTIILKSALTAESALQHITTQQFLLTNFEEQWYLQRTMSTSEFAALDSNEIFVRGRPYPEISKRFNARYVKSTLKKT